MQITDPQSAGLIRATDAMRIGRMLNSWDSVGVHRPSDVSRHEITSLASLPFYTYKTSDTTVKVTGGNLLRSAGLPMRTIPDSAELTVADGDYVWIERNTSSYASVPGWDFKNGAAWPTTKLFYRLATIAISSGVLTITHLWPGGNLTHQDQFPVLLSSPTGNAGDNANNCALTYTVKTMDSAVTLFASTTAPKNARYPLTTYTAGTIGMAYITATGTIEFFALDEVAQIEAIC